MVSEAVNLVQVDVVGVETGQRGVDLLHDGPAGEPGAAGAVVHAPVHLGGEHDVLTPGELPDGSPDELL